MSAADMQESFGRLPDCQPAVEGEVVPLSKQRLVRSPGKLCSTWSSVYQIGPCRLMGGGSRCTSSESRWPDSRWSRGCATLLCGRMSRVFAGSRCMRRECSSALCDRNARCLRLTGMQSMQGFASRSRDARSQLHTITTEIPFAIQRQGRVLGTKSYGTEQCKSRHIADHCRHEPYAVRA